MFNGLNVNQMSVNELRGQIGYVGQEPILFNQTIKENIINGAKHEVSEEELKEVLIISNADYVYRLQRGLMTNVGNLGGQLSGG